MPTVFHPKLYLTTETFLDFLLSTDINRKSTLELGCGSGAISLYLAKHQQVKAHVSDINVSAIEGIKENANDLQLQVSAYQSNLFDNIPLISFDIIIINPPFFAHSIRDVDEYAFNAGEDFQYFKKLSAQLLERKELISQTYMILTDKCDLDSILSHFPNEYYKSEKIYDHQSLGESHLIYSLVTV